MLYHLLKHDQNATNKCRVTVEAFSCPVSIWNTKAENVFQKWIRFNKTGRNYFIVLFVNAVWKYFDFFKKLFANQIKAEIKGRPYTLSYIVSEICFESHTFAKIFWILWGNMSKILGWGQTDEAFHCFSMTRTTTNRFD